MMFSDFLAGLFWWIESNCLILKKNSKIFFRQSENIRNNVVLTQFPSINVNSAKCSAHSSHTTHLDSKIFFGSPPSNPSTPPPHVYLLLAVGGCVRIFSRQVLEMIAKATKGKSCFNLHLYVCVLAEQQHRTNLPHWISYSILAPQKTTKLPQGFQGDSEGNI